MSVFGGDSWAREAQCRKRRVDDLVIEGLDGSSYKKLSSGKYACLVCPHNPILDSSLMLSMHCKGSRHVAAESKLKERESMRQNEINKRLALSEFDVRPNSATLNKNASLVSKPLTEQTKKAAAEILSKETAQLSFRNQNSDVKLSEGYANVMNAVTKFSQKSSCPEVMASDKMLVQQQLDFRDQRERELKFTEAGWKRDCHGRWFRDENVEFDSDEEDPNVSLG